MFKKILVGVDGSDSALRAVTHAADLSKAFDAQLVLMHVVQVSAIAQEALNISATEHLKENPKSILEKLSHEVLDKARDAALEAGAAEDRIDMTTGDGNQARQLIQAATNRKVDLVVVGSRGRGRLEGLLLGSVSQKVAALAPCPCLVV